MESFSLAVQMEDVTRGLKGRRVCGGIKVGVGVLIVTFGAQPSGAQSANGLAIFSGVLMVLAGILGIFSQIKYLVIGYLVSGIICAIFLAISLIVAGVDIIKLISHGILFYGEFTFLVIPIVVVVSVSLALTVTIIGIVFACRPLCGPTQGQGAVQYQNNTSPNVVVPPTYNQGNTAYPNTQQGPV